MLRPEIQSSIQGFALFACRSTWRIDAWYDYCSIPFYNNTVLPTLRSSVREMALAVSLIKVIDTRSTELNSSNPPPEFYHI